MILNDVFWERVYDCTLVHEIFEAVKMRKFLYVRDIAEVVPDLAKLWRGREELIDVWSDYERQCLEENGGHVVARLLEADNFHGYESSGDHLDEIFAHEVGLKSCLCGAQFSFGAGGELRVDVEMAGGSVMTVFANECESRDILIEDTDEKEDVVMDGDQNEIEEVVGEGEFDDDDGDILVVD